MQVLIPEAEAQRMAAVRRYNILDTLPDGAFNRVTALAARRFRVPISIISIVDHDRIWFKSCQGLPDVKQIGRDPGLCASAILVAKPYILTDAKLDPRSLANPLVAGEFGLRFYAGVPLRTSDGHNLGTLCVIAKEPRTIHQAEVADLEDLASLVMDQLELRLSAMNALSQAQLMVREIDHRVANSLQFVCSLLNMQSHSLAADEVAAGHLQAAATRVAAVAQVHRHFYSEAASEMSCIGFVRRLCADLSDILGRTVEVQGDEGDENSSRIQSIGLIVNELVTNAAKHGAGRIEVSYRRRCRLRELRVCDEGPGVPAGFDPGVSKGLGMRIVMSLATQLDGSVTVESGPAGRGACYTVVFPA
ncbi:histidine kinase dimerization/phosphoacceptor domain -containing protein [Roseomonas sp. E05]|uniref:sensor histidine kinase n=1 Tax=Roseomonas sp. E05 TaxID=3046310 RepID=UPI0024B8B859|nr:histidine kinase dimerization/phosphoacceptor domain -containing protein [Roseomonas sp. E05]MDJ0390321.1 histidine kinase dimerization/phosphoacceptor domain -containing protein [Roseomonas sp. E05]